MADAAPAPVVQTGLIHEIADGVWVIPDRRVPLVPNIGIVCGTRAVLVIDTGMGPANGAAVLEAARGIAGARKLLLTLTHFHPEHGFGAQAFADAATIVYNRAQRDELQAKGDAYLALFRGMNAAVRAALEGTVLVMPDIVHEAPGAEIDLGGRIVALQSRGMAHTRGDQTVWLPQERILFTGDLAEEKCFPIFPWFPPDDADIDAAHWIDVLADCEDLHPAIVVPGHGAVGDAAILADVRTYLQGIGDAVRAETARDEAAVIAAIRPRFVARHPDWIAPEWIDFAVRYYLARG